VVDFDTNKTKDFNGPQMEVELNAVSGFPNFTISYRGFEPKDRQGGVTPFPESSRVLGRSVIEGVTTLDSADTGDIRVTTRDPLTGPQQADLDTALNAHVDTVKTPEQQREDQSVIDQASLLTSFNAGIADADLNLTAKLTLRELGEDI